MLPLPSGISVNLYIKRCNDFILVENLLYKVLIQHIFTTGVTKPIIQKKKTLNVLMQLIISLIIIIENGYHSNIASKLIDPYILQQKKRS